MFTLPEAWVWDFWLADDGTDYHLFFLYASSALQDPDARHHRAAVGHAVSPDLRTWRRVSDALVHGDPPSFDELATWTGSVVRHADGTWFLFYTGARLEHGMNVQSIGYATSPDLYRWTKAGATALIEADARWYERLADGQWHDEAFRDPWVFADPDGGGWHMFITARANRGPSDERGVIGHATSGDLRSWTLRPPLSEPGQGFGQLEVMQALVVDGQPTLLFSCLDKDVSAARRASGTPGGVWAARGESLVGPFDVAGAQLLVDRRFYVGRAIEVRGTGRTAFLAFRHDGDDGAFVGGISDPVWLHHDTDRYVLESDAAHPMLG